MSYTPIYTGDDAELSAELQLISQAITEQEEGPLAELHVEPVKSRSGMIRYADGADWNPGQGKQPYWYDGDLGLWLPLSSPFYRRTAAETSAGITPTDRSRESGDLRRLANDDLDNLSASEISDVFGDTLATAGKVLPWDNALVLADVTITVGSGGHFTTINAAIDALKASTNQKAITLNLLTGFVMAEQLQVRQHDLSWVTLTSTDAEVTITRSALTISTGGRFPAFHARFHGTLPRISVLFNMDSSGTATNRDGISVVDFGIVEVVDTFGVKNAGGRGLYAASLGFALATGSIFSGAGQAGYRVSNFGIINCRDGIATGCGRGIECTSGYVHAIDVDVSGAIGTDGILIEGGAINFSSVSGTADASGAARHGVFLDGPGILECENADFSGAGSHGIFASKASHVTGVGVNVSSAGDRGVVAIGGATVDVPNIIANSCTNEGLFASTGGTINAGGGSATGCAGGIEVQTDGRVAADGFNASGSTAAFGVQCRIGSRLMFRNGNAQIGGSPASGDITCLSGSFIYAGGATGGLSKTANTLDSAGVIFN